MNMQLKLLLVFICKLNNLFCLDLCCNDNKQKEF